MPGKKDSLTERWEAEAAKHLKGRTIVEVRYMSLKEAHQCGYHHRPVVFQLDNGALFWPSKDDEGNDAGALMGQDGAQSVTLPVL